MVQLLAQVFAALPALWSSFKAHPFTSAAGLVGGICNELAHDPTFGGALPHDGKVWLVRLGTAALVVLGAMSADGTKAVAPATAPAPK